jgi:hypothetical protein
LLRLRFTRRRVRSRQGQPRCLRSPGGLIIAGDDDHTREAAGGFLRAGVTGR